jgi:hypothetical protein
MDGLFTGRGASASAFDSEHNGFDYAAAVGLNIMSVLENPRVRFRAEPGGCYPSLACSVRFRGRL